MRGEEIIRESRAIEDLLEAFESRFPSQSDFRGYVNHCLRMLNVALALCQDEPDRRQKIEIALAFHDLTIFPDRTLDYLESSAELACQHLTAVGRNEWSEEITLMIVKHHKIGAYTGKSANLVEAFRKADWRELPHRSKVRIGRGTRDHRAGKPKHSIPAVGLGISNSPHCV